MIIIIAIWLIPLILNNFRFCIKDNRFSSAKEFTPIRHIIREIEYSADKNEYVSSLIQTMETNKTTLYNRENYNKKVYKMVHDFFQKYPKNLNTTSNFFDFEVTYHSYAIFFYLPEDIEKLNKNTTYSKIVGISYAVSYSACGKESYGISDIIFKNSQNDIYYNPYRIKIQIAK